MPKISPVTYNKLINVFKAEGFVCARIEGDHMIFTKAGVRRHVVFQ